MLICNVFSSFFLPFNHKNLDFGIGRQIFSVLEFNKCLDFYVTRI